MILSERTPCILIHVKTGEQQMLPAAVSDDTAGSASLLPAGNAAHIGQMMRNALVAIDAGLLAWE